MRSTERLDAFLDERDADAYLFDTDEQSDQYYLSGFTAPDPFVACYRPDGMALLVSGLEYGRATKESRADDIARLGAYDYRSRVAEHGRQAGRIETIAAFLADRAVESVVVPARFPVATADGLRDRGISVYPESSGIITELRSRKTDDEVDAIETVQRANERAMASARDLIASASVGEDGHLYHEGEPLTSERVTRAIEHTLIDTDCALEDTIVAGGADAADPHDRGSGPLPADAPIVVDIFPRSKASRYHADMTRTFVATAPNDDLRDRYAVTERAKEAALETIEPGVTGAAVHDAVCDVYETAGYATLRSDPETDVGFIHSTGHGVGLDVHESPRLGPEGGELEAGHVVTVEPGLYDPAVGGIRLEDLVVVTDSERGYRNLTDFPTEFLV